jgi:hypothetical protein
MALRQAEKQRRFPQRHLGQRLQCLISFHTKLKLQRLAHDHGCSVTTLIENLAADAEEALIQQIAFSDINTYYDAKLQCNQPSLPYAEGCTATSNLSLPAVPEGH